LIERQRPEGPLLPVGQTANCSFKEKSDLHELLNVVAAKRCVAPWYHRVVTVWAGSPAPHHPRPAERVEGAFGVTP
jgi:hypothetical protein